MSTENKIIIVCGNAWIFNTIRDFNTHFYNADVQVEKMTAFSLNNTIGIYILFQSPKIYINYTV